MGVFHMKQKFETAETFILICTPVKNGFVQAEGRACNKPFYGVVKVFSWPEGMPFMFKAKVYKTALSLVELIQANEDAVNSNS